MNQTTDPRLGLPSASRFERLVNCPGSRAAEEAIESTGQSSEVAAFGDRVHEALLTGEISDLAANEEQVFQKIHDMEEEAIAKFLEKFIGIGGSPELLHDIKEQRFWVVDQVGNKITSAQVDRALVWKHMDTLHCLLIDAKTGFLEVTHANANWQLRVGLVALDQAYGPFESSRVAIAQYRLKEAFSRCDYTQANIRHAYNEIVFHDSRSKQQEAPYAAGKHCTYCSARSNCPTLAAYSMLPSVQSATLGLAKKDVVARVATLSLPDLAFIESKRTSATNLFTAVKDRLKTLSDDQLAELGLERVSTGSMPSLPDIPKLWKALADSGLSSEVEFLGFCEVGLGKIKEKLITRLSLKHEITKAAAEKQLMEFLEPHIKREDKEKTIKQIKNG